MRKLALHWQILLGLVIGILIGFVAVQFGWKTFIIDWVKPFGTIFINLLKMIAIPLIITSLVTGVTQLKDISKFSKIGIRAIGLFLITTVTSVVLGLILVNIIKPSSGISESTRQELLTNYAGLTSDKIELAIDSKESGPLQPLVDIVPGNIFEALTVNTNMLQVIFLLFSLELV
jgi:proton glutamate symport protein